MIVMWECQEIHMQSWGDSEMSETNKRLHAIVQGRVQGVSFRHYTTLKARELSCVGWVRNNPDRTVEVIAEGSETKLQALLEFLHVGSPAAQVERVEATWHTAIGEFSIFETRYHR